MLLAASCAAGLLEQTDVSVDPECLAFPPTLQEGEYGAVRCWGAMGYGICCGVAGVFTQRLGLYAGFVASMLIHLLSLVPGGRIPIGARKGVSRWAGCTLCCCLLPPACLTAIG